MLHILFDHVLDLMRETDRDYIDEAQRIVPMPLSFSRVNGGRPITSQTLLFRLPMELTQEVVTYLDTADLKSLALVDRDCRLLARSRLLASVVLDYSCEKWQLLDELSREARVRQSSSGANESPSIGACIRHLTVQTDPHMMECRHEILEGMLSDNSAHAKREEVMESYCGTYLPAIAQALRFSLPNLDRLDWEDFIPISQYMFTAIASLPIRHLGLHRAILGPDCEYPVRPLEQRQRWALQSLDLWPLPAVNHRSRDWSHVARFCKSFLEEVAPTLEKLSCDDHVFPENCAIRFPRLHTLWLDSWTVANDSAFESLFPSSTDAVSCALRFVAINSSRGMGSKCIWIWESLARRGHIPGLEALNLRQIYRDHEIPVIDFLSANPQLKSLLMLSYKPEFLSTKILPFLALNLKFLTSLVLTLRSFVIPPPILDAIGRISSLTSLWVALEEPIPMPQKWIIDSPPSIAALSPLRNLTRLALSEGATGGTLPKSRPPEFGRWVPTNQRRWGDEHSETVRKVVEEYVAVVKSLSWVYLGQLVHRVVGGAVVLEDGGRRMYCPGEPWESSFIVGPGRSL